MLLAKVIYLNADKDKVGGGAVIIKKEHKMSKVYQAEISWADGTTDKTTAKKVNGRWEVGGDNLCATTDLGGKVFIITDGKIYWIKGNRMIFQDNVG